MERQNDECCKKRKKNGTNDIVAVAVSLKWKWGGHVARLDRRRWEHAASMWGLKNRQNENGGDRRTDGARHVQESGRTVVTGGQKPDRTE